MLLTRRNVLLSAAAASVAFPTFVHAAANGHSGAIFSEGGRALRGTDPVGYFTDGAAIAGNEAFSTDWMGVTWIFASATNREAFEMNPRKYAPQYGGYCAYAASKGAAAATDPNAWTIENDKLYLNFSLSVRDIWSRDIPENIAKADKNWPGILSALTS